MSFTQGYLTTTTTVEKVHSPEIVRSLTPNYYTATTTTINPDHKLGNQSSINTYGYKVNMAKQTSQYTDSLGRNRSDYSDIKDTSNTYKDIRNYYSSTDDFKGQQSINKLDVLLQDLKEERNAKKMLDLSNNDHHYQIKNEYLASNTGGYSSNDLKDFTIRDNNPASETKVTSTVRTYSYEIPAQTIQTQTNIISKKELHESMANGEQYKQSNITYNNAKNLLPVTSFENGLDGFQSINNHVITQSSDPIPTKTNYYYKHESSNTTNTIYAPHDVNYMNSHYSMANTGSNNKEIDIYSSKIDNKMTEKKINFSEKSSVLPFPTNNINSSDTETIPPTHGLQHKGKQTGTIVAPERLLDLLFDSASYSYLP